jgi:hypothetical protein
MTPNRPVPIHVLDRGLIEDRHRVVAPCEWGWGSVLTKHTLNIGVISEMPFQTEINIYTTSIDIKFSPKCCKKLYRLNSRVNDKFPEHNLQNDN